MDPGITPGDITSAGCPWHFADVLNDAITLVRYQCAGCGARGELAALAENDLGGMALTERCQCGCEWFHPLRIVYEVRLSG